VIDSALGRMKVEGSLEVSGDLLEPRVQGYLGLNSGELNLDEILALVGDMAYATEETAGPAEGVDTEPAAPGVFDGLTMDVQVILPNALIVRADSLQAPGSSVGLGALDLTLGGSLSATKDKGDTIRLRGAVNTVRGYYDFQGRRFEILRDGSVRFLGLEQMNPTLDIRTRRTIQGVDTYVNVRGSLIEPEIVLASVPPLEEADILSLIVFNQPVNALGAGEQVTLAQRAQALAAGAVAGQLAESIGNVLNVDTFEINMAPEAGRGPEVTIGQQVGDNIYVRLQQGVGDQSTTNLILEYQLTRWLRLQTNVLQGSSAQQSLFRRAQGSGIDLIFFFSY
jgi:autotransporter translocation and assembly factor TamB